MKRGEQILRAMNNIGDDLVDMAEQQTFSRSPWRRILPAAACLVLILGTAAGFRRLAAEPVRQEPAAQEPILERPAEETAPDSPAEAPVPGSSKEDPGPEAPVTYAVETGSEKLASARELNGQPFYIFDPDPENDDGPSKAIAPDGTVLFETPDGQIEPLIDRLTGEYIAIMVCRRAAGTAIEGYQYDIYALDGKQVVTGMAAYDVDCLGNVILLLESDGSNYRASVFRRDSYELLRNDFRTAMIVGDCIWLTPQDGDGSVQYLMDGAGNLTVMETPVDSYFVWQDQAYFVTGRGESGMGLANAGGTQLIENKYKQVFYGISSGYARCEDETGHYLVDINTGEAVFRWDYPILDACDGMVAAHTADDQYALMDWNGTVLVTGTGLRTIDEDADGNVDLFVIVNETGFVHVDMSGHVLAVTPREQTDIGDHITSRTVALMDPLEDGSYRLSLLDLTSGDRTTLEGSYATTSPIREGNRYTGLFYASYAENGEMYCQVIREDGTILLSGLSDMWTRQGDVFYTDDGAARGLLRLDGTWLYQEPAQ